MKSAHIIYYHDPDYYEGQDRPFGIVESEERAKTICAEIIEFGQKLAAKMKYPNEEGLSDEEFILRNEMNKAILMINWPYGWFSRIYSDFEADWHHEDGEAQRMVFDVNTVAHKELPLL